MNSVMEQVEKTSAPVKTPIGQLLLAGQLIIPHDLDFALEHQKYSKELLGEILVRMGALDRENLELALAQQCALLVN